MLLLAAKILSNFSTTYVPVNNFFINEKYKVSSLSYILDESLETELICSVAELEPDYMKQIQEIKSLISHWFLILLISNNAAF